MLTRAYPGLQHCESSSDLLTSLPLHLHLFSGVLQRRAHLVPLVHDRVAVVAQCCLFGDQALRDDLAYSRQRHTRTSASTSSTPSQFRNKPPPRQDKNKPQATDKDTRVRLECAIPSTAAAGPSQLGYQQQATVGRETHLNRLFHDDFPVNILRPRLIHNLGLGVGGGGTRQIRDGNANWRISVSGGDLNSR